MTYFRLCIALVLALVFATPVVAQSDAEGPVFPVEPILFADDPFRGCEGISFNGEGRLLVTCNQAFWEISTDGSLRQITELFSNLGTAAYGDTLCPAQRFSSIRPVVGTDMIWSMALKEGKPVKDAKLVVRLGPNAFPDGLAMDEEGRLYIAANRAGKIWRYDSVADETQLVAEGMPGCASLAFGEGDFDHHSIYATATTAQGRGGKIWRVPVGVGGARLYR